MVSSTCASLEGGPSERVGFLVYTVLTNYKLRNSIRQSGKQKRTGEQRNTKVKDLNITKWNLDCVANNKAQKQWAHDENVPRQVLRFH